MLFVSLMSNVFADSASCVAPGAREAQLRRFRKWFKSGPGATHDIALRTVEEGASDDTSDACTYEEMREGAQERFFVVLSLVASEHMIAEHCANLLLTAHL